MPSKTTSRENNWEAPECQNSLFQGGLKRIELQVCRQTTDGGTFEINLRENENENQLSREACVCGGPTRPELLSRRAGLHSGQYLPTADILGWVFWPIPGPHGLGLNLVEENFDRNRCKILVYWLD